VSSQLSSPLFLFLFLSRLFLDVSANYPFFTRCLFVFFPGFSLSPPLSLSFFFLSSLYRIPHIVVTLVNETQKKVVVRRKFHCTFFPYFINISSSSILTCFSLSLSLSLFLSTAKRTYNRLFLCLYRPVFSSILNKKKRNLWLLPKSNLVNVSQF
jgi:hypothetical protein